MTMTRTAKNRLADRKPSCKRNNAKQYACPLLVRSSIRFCQQFFYVIICAVLCLCRLCNHNHNHKLICKAPQAELQRCTGQQQGCAKYIFFYFGWVSVHSLKKTRILFGMSFVWFRHIDFRQCQCIHGRLQPTTNCKTTFSLHVVESASDDYNF